AVVGIGNLFNSLIHSVAQNSSLAKQLFGYAILGIALTECYCIVCLNDGLFDFIHILIEERRLNFHKISTSFT
ncbi:atp synthase subunit 9, partial [Quercus suber]